MVAKDIMRRRVVSVRPEMTLRDLARLFTDRGISGAPVVDSRGALLGVISKTDLVRQERQAAVSHVPPFYRQSDELGTPHPVQLEAPDFTRVRDAMTPTVLSADEETPLSELARFMLKRRIHRVIITRDGKSRGIVTSMDVLRGLLEEFEALAFRASRDGSLSPPNRRWGVRKVP